MPQALISPPSGLIFITIVEHRWTEFPAANQKPTSSIWQIAAGGFDGLPFWKMIALAANPPKFRVQGKALGFTLVELMVSMVVLLVLGGVVFSMTSATGKI